MGKGSEASPRACGGNQRGTGPTEDAPELHCICSSMTQGKGDGRSQGGRAWADVLDVGPCTWLSENTYLETMMCESLLT